MATEHEYWLECGDIYALGALDGDELKEFQAHLGSNCQICAAYLRETRETLNLLHRSLGPVTPRPEIKARVVDEIKNEQVVSITTPQPKQPTRWPRITGAIAAGIIGFILAGTYYQYHYEPRRMDSVVITLLRDPSTRDLPLYGAGPSPEARGRFLWNDSGEGHIFVANLPSVPQGKTYAVWTIARNSAPRYVGAIATDANGQGTAHIKSTPSGSPPETFAVSLEDEGTTAAPAGPIVLISKQS